ncbi:MAG TPA: hypothetical protein VNP98_08135 [Chthoniobacterales bacterium]|nr:hypothetical protein [Chthoniobacterales bacterium]
MKNRIALAALLIGISLAAPARAGDDMMPNPKLTPGRVAQRDKDRRGVTEAMERKVFARYGIPWSRRAEFKIDHLIPVELDGADTIDNLWPQSRRVKPYGAERKEFLTQHLLALIAAGKMTIAQAQKEISEDWISCFVDHLGMVYLRK